MSAICLDTSAWIEVTHAGANAETFAKALSSAAAELLAFLQQHTVIPVTAEITTLGIRHQLSMAHALIYATARHQDADLKDLPHVHHFPKSQS